MKLGHLDDWLADRRRIANRYGEAFAALGIPVGGESLNRLHVIRVPQP